MELKYRGWFIDNSLGNPEDKPWAVFYDENGNYSEENLEDADWDFFQSLSDCKAYIDINCEEIC